MTARAQQLGCLVGVTEPAGQPCRQRSLRPPKGAGRKPSRPKPLDIGCPIQGDAVAAQRLRLCGGLDRVRAEPTARALLRTSRREQSVKDEPGRRSCGLYPSLRQARLRNRSHETFATVLEAKAPIDFRGHWAATRWPLAFQILPSIGHGLVRDSEPLALERGLSRRPAQIGKECRSVRVRGCLCDRYGIDNGWVTISGEGRYDLHVRIGCSIRRVDDPEWSLAP